MPRTGIILLAAGGSSRLGSPKQLFPCEGEPLLLRVTRVALRAAVDPVVVVLGAHAAECRAILQTAPVQIVENEGWRDGMASSLCAGLLAMPDAMEGVIVALGDQPRVTPAHLEALQSAGERLAASGYAGTAGPPAYFPRRFFSELLQLRGDRGAQSVLLRHRDALNVIPLPGGEFDLDTPEHGARFLSPGLEPCTIHSGHGQGGFK